MTGQERFILLGYLLQGVLSRDFAIWVPDTIEALSGSCVRIPCRFEVPSEHDKLTAMAKGLWQKGGTGGRVIFDSSETDEENEIAGRLLGQVHKKNCTTVLDNFPSSYSDSFFFRVENPTEKIKFTIRKGVKIMAEDTAPKPSLPPEPVEVTERTPVNLSCSAAAPCPELPPNLTWTPSLGEIVHQLQENEDETKYVSSVLTFIASHLHHGQKITCRALYTLQQRNCLRISQATLTLKVLYKPQISGSGSCNRTAAHISCSCETHGNPSPSMEWRVSGLQVTNSTDTVIRKEHLGNTSLRSSLTMSYTKRVTPTVFCLSTNTVGSSSLQLHVPCLQPLLDFFSSLLIGVLVGTLMTCLLWCVALFLKQKMSKNFAKDSQELQVRNATENQTDPAPVQREPSLNLPLKPVEDIYANHQMVASKKREEGQREDSHTPRLTPTMTQGQAGEDTLHYASVKFTARKTDKETAATARPIYDNV